MPDSFKERNDISEPNVTIFSDAERFKVDRLEGTALTGVIDVEKFVRLDGINFFLEKKLPFQIVIITSPEHK